MQLIGQNPRAPQIQAAMMAHIAEHAGFLYRQKIEQQLGFSLPPEDEQLPPQVEVALSTMMAQASQQVLQQSQAQAAQQQAQQQAQDPLVQMQMQELQLKQQELQLKQQKIALDASAQADRLELDRERLDGQLQLDGMKTQAQIEEIKARVAGEQEREGVRLGLEAAKAREQSDFQRKQAMVNQLNAYRDSRKKEKPNK